MDVLVINLSKAIIEAIIGDRPYRLFDLFAFLFCFASKH